MELSEQGSGFSGVCCGLGGDGRRGFEFLQFFEQVFAAFYFAGFLETDDIGAAAGGGFGGGDGDEVAGGFDFLFFPLPFVAHVFGGLAAGVFGVVADEDRTLKVFDLSDEGFDFLGFGEFGWARCCLCGWLRCCGRWGCGGAVVAGADCEECDGLN